mgnify:CR=1 FL=1
MFFSPKYFFKTLVELEPYFKFKLNSNLKVLTDTNIKDFDGIICHEESFLDESVQKICKNIDCFKILATQKNTKNTSSFDTILRLPSSVKEINDVVESSAAKKQFNKNSSIEIKSYLLNKNEKKLIKNDISIILTEKEIQLLELFLNKKKAISKNEILTQVWHYSSDADTHTVQTHIYRLRKKINNKFADDSFILNNKEGYYL